MCTCAAICAFECIRAHPCALAEDHRVLIQLLSVFEDEVGCSVPACVFGTRLEGCCGSTLVYSGLERDW